MFLNLGKKSGLTDIKWEMVLYLIPISISGWGKCQESLCTTGSFLHYELFVSEVAHTEKLATEGEQKLLRLNRPSFIGILLY